MTAALTVSQVHPVTFLAESFLPFPFSLLILTGNNHLNLSFLMNTAVLDVSYVYVRIIKGRHLIKLLLLKHDGDQFSVQYNEILP